MTETFSNKFSRMISVKNTKKKQTFYQIICACTIKLISQKKKKENGEKRRRKEESNGEEEEEEEEEDKLQSV